MPFAGKIKLKTFIIITTLGMGGALGGGYLLGSMGDKETPSQQHVTQADFPTGNAEQKTPSRSHTSDQSSSQTTHSSNSAQETYQDILLHFRGQPVLGGKRKDVDPSQAWKANLYQDDGFTVINRAKLDKDRDEKWDEKWTYKPDGAIEVQISTRDNNEYDQIKRWMNGQWTYLKGESAPAAAKKSVEAHRKALKNEKKSNPSSSKTIQLSPAQTSAMNWHQKSLPGKKAKDVAKGQPFKLNVYQDKGHHTVNRLKMDLDRDGKWDEKWTFHEDGKISKKVAPNDDENYNKVMIWSGSQWNQQ